VKSVRSSEDIVRSRDEAVRRRAEKESSGRELRPMQRTAMAALERSGWESAIVIMPTGSGKTALVWSFKRKEDCSIIFAPYTLLADQLVLVLGEYGKTFRWPLTTQQGSIDMLLANAQFVVASFEAAPDCIGLITQLHQRRRLGPIWVDEVGRDI
jgi:hypothetical protein